MGRRRPQPALVTVRRSVPETGLGARSCVRLSISAAAGAPRRPPLRATERKVGERAAAAADVADRLCPGAARSRNELDASVALSADADCERLPVRRDVTLDLLRESISPRDAEAQPGTSPKVVKRDRPSEIRLPAEFVEHRLEAARRLGSRPRGGRVRRRRPADTGHPRTSIHSREPCLRSAESLSRPQPSSRNAFVGDAVPPKTSSRAHASRHCSRTSLGAGESSRFRAPLGR